MRAGTKIGYLNRIKKKPRKFKPKRSPRRRKRGGFLNRCNFANAGRDTVNTVMQGLNNFAPKLASQTSREVIKISEARIKQAINSGRQQIQKIASRIIRGAIEDVCKTLFRLLGNLGKQKSNQLKCKIFKLIKK